MIDGFFNGRFFAAAMGGLCVLAGAVSVFAQWEQGRPMPSTRTEVAVAAVDGRVFVAGGFGGGRNLEIYDPRIDQWSAGAPVPERLHHAAAVALSSRLYLIGGYGSGWGPVDSMFEYDPAADRWRRLAPLPTPRGALAAAVVNGRIHAVGGTGPGRRNTPVHEVYDPGTNSWSEAAPLPTPRDHLAAAAVDGKLYAIGGRVDGSYARNLDVNESYDPSTDSWVRRAPLPTARSGIAAAVLTPLPRWHGRWAPQYKQILVFGGESPQGTFNEVEAYDPRFDRWSTLAPMPTARHGLGAAALEGRVYVVSGGPTPGGSYSAANEIYTPEQ